MNVIHRSTFELPASDIDAANRVKPSALFRYMQDGASSNAAQLGCGYAQMEPLGIFWVLSWARLVCDRSPAHGDTITVETWPKGVHKLYSLRDFFFEDAEGRHFARATTAWVILNRDSRRIMTREALPARFTDFPDRVALPDLPDKLPLDGVWTPVAERSILYSDIDVNGHVNNTRYVDFLCDAFPLERHLRQRIAAFTIRYHAETKQDETLVLEIREEGDPAAPSLMKAVKADGTLVFHARVEWERPVTTGF
jgi:acyl-ACP thioesterase